MKSTSDATLYNVGFPPRLWQMVFGLITFNAQSLSMSVTVSLLSEIHRQPVKSTSERGTYCETPWQQSLSAALNGLRPIS